MAGTLVCYCFHLNKDARHKAHIIFFQNLGINATETNLRPRPVCERVGPDSRILPKWATDMNPGLTSSASFRGRNSSEIEEQIKRQWGGE